MALPDFTVELETALGTIMDGQDTIDTHPFLGAFLNDKGPWQDVIKAAIIAAKDEGLFKPCPNGGDHDLWAVDQWNKLAEGQVEDLHDYELNVIVQLMNQHLYGHLSAWSRDPEGKGRAAHPEKDALFASLMADIERVETITRERLPVMAALLNDQLQNPVTPRYERIIYEHRSEVDHSAIGPMLDGWTLHVASKTYDGPLTPVPVVASLPPVIHYRLPTCGRVVLFSSRDSVEFLVEKLHHLECDEIGLPHDYSSNSGVNGHRKAVFEASGILSLNLGDHFPGIYRENGVLRGMTNGEYPERTNLEILRDHSMDNPAFASWESLAAFISEDLLNAGVESGELIVFETDPGVAHLYLPDGWRAEDFADLFEGEGRPAEISEVEDEYTYFLLSPREISFDDRLVTHVDLAA